MAWRRAVLWPGVTRKMTVWGRLLGCHGACQNQPPSQSHPGGKRLLAAWHLHRQVPWASGVQERFNGDSQQPRNVARIGSWHLPNASGGSFQILLLVHPVVPTTQSALAFHVRGAGSQGGRSEGCFGQCFAPAGAGAIRCDGAEWNIARARRLPGAGRGRSTVVTRLMLPVERCRSVTF